MRAQERGSSLPPREWPRPKERTENRGSWELAGYDAAER